MDMGGTNYIISVAALANAAILPFPVGTLWPDRGDSDTCHSCNRWQIMAPSADYTHKKDKITLFFLFLPLTLLTQEKLVPAYR